MTEDDIYPYMTDAKGIPIYSDYELVDGEAEGYAAYAVDKLGGNVRSVEVRHTDDSAFVDIKVNPKNIEPFERIRRITGYLVGETDRWNDAKKAELNDRVKHGVDA